MRQLGKHHRFCAIVAAGCDRQKQQKQQQKGAVSAKSLAAAAAAAVQRLQRRRRPAGLCCIKQRHCSARNANFALLGDRATATGPHRM
jgi:hypothetical protein